MTRLARWTRRHRQRRPIILVVSSERGGRCDMLPIMWICTKTSRGIRAGQTAHQPCRAPRRTPWRLVVIGERETGRTMVAEVAHAAFLHPPARLAAADQVGGGGACVPGRQGRGGTGTAAVVAGVS